ncbi:MAG: multicopper oxidase domain-containing protein [Hyphomicrobium sp.]|nr:multicopper oxidase domain-containing protein [Hyphomicrobium sp.]
MYIDEKASGRRQREAENARNNRFEIKKALNDGQVSRRDLFRMGIFTATGALAMKNGLSQFAPSAYAAVPTGTPRSPLFGARKFTQELPRDNLVDYHTLERDSKGNARFPSDTDEPDARRLSYHTEYTELLATDPYSSKLRDLTNPRTWRGPIEGRPPGEFFGHQRWDTYFPHEGYVISISPCQAGTKFHPLMQTQHPNSVWCWGAGRFTPGNPRPPLIKMRYGEPMLCRIYNNLPLSKSDNNGFGINQISTHFHNAHNGAESDGANNAYHYPGTFYDYRWGATLARMDTINTAATDRRASGPTDSGGLKLVPGDYREIQGTMWFHDHRFFFTAENVYKGNFGRINMYSGPDRGNEVITDGVNLRLPSGSLLPWGNIDFDVNLSITDNAFRQNGQLFFDIFDSDGTLGDVVCVNNAYAPFMKVLPRKYRFRILNASVARFFRLAIASPTNTNVPFQFIANDGNLVPRPITLSELDEQGSGERYDIVVDFSKFKIGDKLHLVNMLYHKDGRKPEGRFSLAAAMRGFADDPAVGSLLQFIVSSEVKSVDVPGVTHYATTQDRSVVPSVLTGQILQVAPKRVRHIEFKRLEPNPARDCIPSCEDKDFLPWAIRVDGETTHTLNANRISMLIPRPGETEHWVMSTGGGWDHPVHLHFEEALTLDRGGAAIPATERLVRKDIWRLRPGGTVKIQVTFGEFGGSYVTHCHNTVHEDFAMLMRFQVLGGGAGAPQLTISPTPIPSVDGVTFLTPEVLPEAIRG